MMDNLWHTLEKEEVVQQLNSSESGLEEEEAHRRLKQFGPNTLRLKNSETALRILIRQLQNPIVYLLLFATLLALLIREIEDSVVIFIVVLLNTAIGFFQEYRANKVIRALISMVPHETTVVRSGESRSIHSSQIVPGDLVVLQAGDRISADLRLLSVKNLHCDESTLTGESLPIHKRVDSVAQSAPIGDRKCMAFNGTYVTSGVGMGLVVSTGLKTEFGKISALIEKIAPLETPLSLSIKKIAQWVTLAILLISGALFWVGLIRGSSLFDAALAAVTMAVAAIPEGLPAIITIASSVGVRQMGRKGAIIRQLPAVESLGSTSVICTDKTGTLTYNEMAVQRVWTHLGSSFVSGAGYSHEGHFFPKEAGQEEEIIQLLRGAILCSDAFLDRSGAPFGDPTEIALVVAGRKVGILESDLREEWRREDVIPFESERRIMATLNSSPNGERSIFIKGAPEEILALCDLSSNLNSIEEAIVSMAKDGMRVLAIASKSVPLSTIEIGDDEIKSGYTLLGTLGMIDPPRHEVYGALRACREAGITVKMVTGDHPLTAEVVASDLGILGEGGVLTGFDIDQMNSDEWRRAAYKTHVFARVSPEHKLKLIETFQASDDVVAMTGDGVNDAPALKRADIGIAMGIKGTSIAKEASGMVLANDNFATIEAAIEEGRRVYDNLLKSLVFLIPANLGQALIILISVLFFPISSKLLIQPISPIQILWVNLVVAIALSLPLAFEPAEPNIMKRPPRKKRAPLLSRPLLIKSLLASIVIAGGTIGLFFWKLLSEGATVAEAQTMAVTTIILFLVFYLFECRSLKWETLFSNHFIFIGIGTVLIAQSIFIYLPFMNQIFNSSSLDWKEWLISTLVALLILPITALKGVVAHK